MKGKTKSILGVALTLMLTVSLLFWSAPVAADTLEWASDDVDPPEEFEAGLDIVDMVVSAGGLAIYVVDGTSTMYASGDTGESWEEATIYDDATLNADFVAVAPDDPQYVAVVGGGGGAADNATVYITEDSGATWDSLGAIVEGDNLTAFDIAVSMESGDNRFVAVAGTDLATTDGQVWYYEIGALGAEWTQISVTEINTGIVSGWDNDQDIVAAVAFSPNFNSDEILLAVSNNGTVSRLEVFSFNTETWNESVGGFVGYPVELDTEDAAAGALMAADIAPSPDYLGSDDDMRQVFVGIASSDTTAVDSDGIFLCDDDDAEALEYGELIHSVDFDGTNLVAGSHDGTTVFYSSDPLEGDDADVDSSSSKKSPSGETQCVVAFAGSTVVAGTVGNDSAFAVSEDMGDNFNDITLIDGEIAVDGMLDFAVSADGSVKYLLTVDNTTTEKDMSLWRLDNDLWERVLFTDNVTGVKDYIIRIAPDDPDVIYLADADRGTGTTIYYSSDGGQTSWHNRTSRYPIYDLAVETDGGVAYVLTESGYVSKSVNTGFTWGSKETSMQSGDYNIQSLGEDLLLVGGSSGTDAVAYSIDGNESWTDLDPIGDDANVQVCAEGLDDGDYIFAVNDSTIYWLELGEGDWEDDLGDLATGYVGTGIALVDDILYVLTSNTTDSTLIRFLDPWGDEAGDESSANASADFGAAPTALRVSAGSTNLWAVDRNDALLYNFEDTIAVIGPTLKSPSSGSDIPMNEISGDPNNVNLVWESPSDEVTQFEFDLAFDEDFDEDSGFGVTLAADSYDEGDTVNDVVLGTNLVPDATYYWRVKVVAPVESPWSKTWSFTVEEAEAAPPVTVETPPAPEITVEMPAPEVTVTVPPMVQVPPAPAPIAPGYVWGIIAIGALLVVALIVLIFRTRRVV